MNSVIQKANLKPTLKTSFKLQQHLVISRLSTRWIHITRVLVASQNQRPPKARYLAKRNVQVDGEHVINLRPPPDYPVDETLAQLSSALSALDLDNAIKAWSHLYDLGATFRLESCYFKSISKFIASVLHSKTAPNMSRMAVKTPEAYGFFINMATESAARDHIHGLYVLSLRLLSSGRPADVVNAYNKTKAIMRRLQGKDEKNLSSWDREKRLAARLEGEGLRTLIIINIAALTLLDQCDETAFFGMLDANTDLRPSSKFDFTTIKRVLSRLTSPSGSNLYEQFRINVNNFILALQAYHPNAFIRRINMYGHSKSSSKLEKLYHRVLNASVGENAFLRVRDLDDWVAHSHPLTYIPLPVAVWATFVKAFEYRLNAQCIVSLVEVHFPARGLRPDHKFLSLAMLSLTYISARPDATSEVRQMARQWADKYWRRITVEGLHTEDLVFARRIKMLDILGRNEPRLKTEVVNLYGAASAGHLGRIGPKTRAAFVDIFMARGDLKGAMRVFKVFPHDTSNLGQEEKKEHDYTESVSTFVKRLAVFAKAWSDQTPFIYCAKILEFVAQTKTPINISTLGPLLSLQLNVGLPVKQTVDTILSYTTCSSEPKQSIQRWTQVMNGLLLRGNLQKLNEKEFEAGLYILERASEEELFGQKLARECELWLAFLRPLACSSISPSSRFTLISSACSLFPKGSWRIPSALMFEIIYLLLTREDRTGFGEGWARWENFVTERSEMKGREVEGVWWEQMLSTLLSLHLTSLAFTEKLVLLAWNKGDPLVSANDPFWARAKREGIIRKLELVEQLSIKMKEKAMESHWRETLLSDRNETVLSDENEVETIREDEEIEMGWEEDEEKLLS
ncbi:hypothetical protein L204_106426 [Cryptococcus depauperatus]|nr:hypothetical protein L204_06183 [Cryptococcus depauperatus CBS 7855]